MLPRIELSICYALLTCFFLTGCKRGSVDERHDIDSNFTTDTTISFAISDTFSSQELPKEKTPFYGDTVWINPYGSQEWQTSISGETYSAAIKVQVDTTDYIIDTVKSKKGNRIVIGYNHIYNIKLSKENNFWFVVSFDKKNDLKNLLKGTDYWLESNLDVFQNLVYNKKYEMFIIAYDINPRYNFGTVYYIVFNTEGVIQYIGTSGHWGGGGSDWESFLTNDSEMYVTGYELYSFSKKASSSISDYTEYADILKEIQTSAIEYKQVHAVRNLFRNNFLVVYEQSNGNPEYNAIILNTDSIILDRFRYYGLMEDVDAMFLFYTDTVNSRYFVHDTEREVLVCIENKDPLNLKEISESVMKKLPDDTLLSENFIPVDFESFGSKIFYISGTDSVIFYSGGSIE